MTTCPWCLLPVASDAEDTIRVRGIPYHEGCAAAQDEDAATFDAPPIAELIDADYDE
jgi:hypothetical protein